jgi:hypothetical protein
MATRRVWCEVEQHEFPQADFDLTDKGWKHIRNLGTVAPHLARGEEEPGKWNLPAAPP